MATAVVSQQKVRSDDIFFPTMALLILGVVVVGFAQSYFFAGMLFAKLPSTLVHIHGALFVSWIFFLVIQTSLVAARKVKWHMTLGIGGLVLPPLMVVVGVLTLFLRYPARFLHSPGAPARGRPRGTGSFRRAYLLGVA